MCICTGVPNNVEVRVYAMNIRGYTPNNTFYPCFKVTAVVSVNSPTIIKVFSYTNTTGTALSGRSALALSNGLVKEIVSINSVEKTTFIPMLQVSKRHLGWKASGLTKIRIWPVTLELLKNS